MEWHLETGDARRRSVSTVPARELSPFPDAFQSARLKRGIRRQAADAVLRRGLPDTELRARPLLSSPITVSCVVHSHVCHELLLRLVVRVAILVQLPVVVGPRIDPYDLPTARGRLEQQVQRVVGRQQRPPFSAGPIKS